MHVLPALSGGGLTRREYGTWRIEEVGFCGALDKRNFASEVSLSRDVGPSNRRLGIIPVRSNLVQRRWVASIRFTQP